MFWILFVDWMYESKLLDNQLFHLAYRKDNKQLGFICEHLDEGLKWFWN